MPFLNQYSCYTPSTIAKMQILAYFNRRRLGVVFTRKEFWLRARRALYASVKHFTAARKFVPGSGLKGEARDSFSFSKGIITVRPRLVEKKIKHRTVLVKNPLYKKGLKPKFYLKKVTRYDYFSILAVFARQFSL